RGTRAGTGKRDLIGWCVMNEPPSNDLPEQLRVRREKRAELLSRGIQPYALGFERTHTLASVRAEHEGLEAGAETGKRVAIAGRVIFLRNTGKLCFARLREGDGTELQVMLSLDRVGEQSLADWKHV